MFGNDHYMTMLIKMEPSESEKFSDLALSISQQGYKNHKEIIDNIQKGDHLNFRAKVKSIGNEFRLHHVHLIDGDENTKNLEDTGHTKDLDHVEQQDVRLP